MRRHHKPIDFETIKRLVPIGQVLSLIGWVPNLSEPGGAMRGDCPLCGDNRIGVRTVRQFHVRPPRSWFCHQCEAGGNLLDLFARVEGVSLVVAAIRLCGRSGLSVPRLQRSERSLF